ncbi:hypothetical protein D0Y65_053196 [Glycine soja]|nr:hypothetical protein D0Y65_053196 [Glycine soja]
MMSLASFQGHSALVEPSLQPSTAAQPCAPTITIMPFSVPTAQNMVSTSVPPSHTMPCKDKRSNRRVCRGISNLMPHASSQGHSTRVEPPLKPSTEAQPRALVITFIPPSIPTAQNLVSASDPLLRSISWIFVLPCLNQFLMFYFGSTQLHAHNSGLICCVIQYN